MLAMETDTPCCDFTTKKRCSSCPTDPWKIGPVCYAGQRREEFNKAQISGKDGASKKNIRKSWDDKAHFTREVQVLLPPEKLAGSHPFKQAKDPGCQRNFKDKMSNVLERQDTKKH